MAANKKTGAGTPAASHSNNPTEDHFTSQRGRRAIVHLWTAARAVHGAALTHDDRALIFEALSEIAGAIQ